MTMLDRMRRHKSWLKWSLFLVVLSFIVFYIPSFLDDDTSGAAPNEAVATVGGESITVDAFRRAYQTQLQAYQRAYGSSLNEQFLRQMGIDQQILQQLIDERAATAEARRLGLTVSDQEVAQRIYAIPAFQQNGQFAGHEAYRQVLQMQRPPLTTSEFEDNLRRALLVEKLRSAVTDWISVGDQDVEQEYRRRNEKAKLELVVFSADKLRDQVTVSDADLASHFEQHKEQYRVGEKRKIRYLLVDADALKSKVVVPAGDVERYYQQNLETFSTPEQVRASHILLKTEGKDEAPVKAKAEALLKQVKGGADFAELAKANSEDSSAAQGGDLDYFGRGRMVKEFEDVAFSLAPGSISDLVKTQFGYHIIKVVDKKAASTRSLADVRAQISDQLSYERAQAQAGDLANALAKEIAKPADLDAAARKHGLTVQESGFFTRDEPIMGIGPAPDVSEQAFTVKDGTVAGPLRTARGPVFLAGAGKQEPRIPALAEVRERVRDDATRAKARELSRTRAEALAADFKADFAAAARKAGLEVKTTELVTRGSTLPEVGASPAIDAAAFALPAGSVTAPIATDAGTVVARVVEKLDVQAADIAAGKDAVRADLQNERRTRFFSAYMLKARDRMKTEINQDLVKRVVG